VRPRLDDDSALSAPDARSEQVDMQFGRFPQNAEAPDVGCNFTATAMICAQIIGFLHLVADGGIQAGDSRPLFVPTIRVLAQSRASG
jgi:hypothetical protein